MSSSNNFLIENGVLKQYRGPGGDVVIPESVREIGHHAFSGCAGLTRVTIPDGVTEIGYSAFSGCKSLRSMTIPDSVTSIGYGAFYGCESLTSVTLPASVTSISGSALYGCESLTSVTIPANVKSVGLEAFYGCASLTSATLPAGLTEIGSRAFEGCESLTSVVIPDSVTRIGDSAFSGCTSLTSVTLPESLASIGSNAFSGCASLTSVTIPAGLTEIGWDTFSGCESLTSVTLPGSLASIGGNAFSGCESLTSVTIPDSVTSIGGSAFSDCKSLTSVTLPASLTEIGDGAFYGCAGLMNIVIPARVASIGSYAFKHCSNLTRVTISQGVTSIGDRAFEGCESLTSVTIPASVTEIRPLAFSDCVGLQDEQGLVIVRGVLYDCVKKDVTRVVIPEGVTSIGGWAFDGCVGLTSVVIPEGVTSIGEYAFYSCAGLASVTILDGVKIIGDSAFSGCTGLMSVTLPESVTEIGKSAFSGCASLTSVTLPGGVTSIGKGAFSGCTGLTSVTLPEGVTSIGDSAFSGCTGLTNVTYPGTDEQLGAIGFGEDNEVLCIQLQKSGREPSGACGETTTWRLAVDGVLTIGGTGKMTSVPWLNYSGQIRAVVIGRGVEALLMEVTIGKDYLSEKRKVWANHGIQSLERFSVEEGSKYYASVDGVLFNKKLTRLESFPPAREDECYRVPESAKTIRANAFQYSKVKFVQLPRTIEKLPKGALEDIYVSTYSTEVAAKLDRPVYLGDIENLPAKVKNSAVQGFLYALAHGVKEMEPWADSYANYIKRNSKTYITQMAENAPLLRLMLEKKLLSESDVKTLLESAKGAEMTAALLTYQQEQFGGRKRKDEFSLDDSDPAMKRAVQTALRREQIKDQKGIAGLTFVATGEMEHFGTYDEYTGAHDFDDLMWYIEERGGNLRSAVSSKTDYLICNDPASTTVKSKKAAELGVPVITETQFLQMAEGK